MKPARSLRLPRQTLAPKRQQGFSLVELMVALTLGLIVVGGVISVFVTNQQAFRTTESLSRVQENARIAFELMAREVRQEGGNPCGSTSFLGNVLRTNDWSTDWGAGTLIGYEGGTAAPFVATGTGANQRVAGTDAISMLSSAIGFSAAIAAHDPTTARITLAAASPGLLGTVVMVCDTTSATIAQTMATSAGGPDTISFDTTANCTTSFGFPVTCASPLPKTFAAGGFVSPLNASAWYIGFNSRGGRSLFRQGRGGGPEEIAEGVTDMQIDYLSRNLAVGPDGLLDTDWTTADAANWAITPANSRQVEAVRFTLTLQTLNNVGTDAQPIERELTYLVNLRNRVR